MLLHVCVCVRTPVEALHLYSITHETFHNGEGFFARIPCAGAGYRGVQPVRCRQSEYCLQPSHVCATVGPLGVLAIGTFFIAIECWYHPVSKPALRSSIIQTKAEQPRQRDIWAHFKWIQIAFWILLKCCLFCRLWTTMRMQTICNNAELQHASTSWQQLSYNRIYSWIFIGKLNQIKVVDGWDYGWDVMGSFCFCWLDSTGFHWIPAKVRSARHGRLTLRSFGSKGKAVELEAPRCNSQKSTRKNAGYLIYKRKSWIITVGKFVEFLLSSTMNLPQSSNDRLFEECFIPLAHTGPCHTGWQIPSACDMDQWSQISQVGFV